MISLQRVSPRPVSYTHLDVYKRQAYTCYVKKGGRKLEGIVSLRALVIADDDVQVSELMNTEYVYVSVHDDQEEVAETFKKYGFLAIPVVDNEHRLVGIITFDDILDVIEEETTEDIELSLIHIFSGRRTAGRSLIRKQEKRSSTINWLRC